MEPEDIVKIISKTFYYLGIFLVLLSPILNLEKIALLGIYLMAAGAYIGQLVLESKLQEIEEQLKTNSKYDSNNNTND